MLRNIRIGILTLPMLLMIAACGKKDSGKSDGDSAESQEKHPKSTVNEHGFGWETGESGYHFIRYKNENVLCAVMGVEGPDHVGRRDVFVDFAEKRYFFCCPMCPPEFNKDPEKYIKEMGAVGVPLSALNDEDRKMVSAHLSS